jgi:hypothetical protein
VAEVKETPVLENNYDYRHTIAVKKVIKVSTFCTLVKNGNLQGFVKDQTGTGERN